MKYISKNNLSYYTNLLKEKFMNYKGTWNATDTYEKNDVVEYGNLFFIATSKVAINKNPNSNASLWKKMNYASHYSNVQTNSSTNNLYLIGSLGTGNNQNLLIPANNRPSVNPSTGLVNVKDLSIDGKHLQEITGNFVKSTSINNIVKMTQQEYDELTDKEETTLYIIIRRQNEF